ncbi:MAG: hypothetical protein IIZ12_02605 [Eggerthellaceae bacterium]|nr:hypothetical protein [Eggerthellaceae bacterium]
MTGKVDQRLPKDSGATKLPSYAAIKSPWERMYGFREAMRYAARYEAVLGAAVLQGIRILIPDYEERAQTICQAAYDRMYATSQKYGITQDFLLNMHPFMCGEFLGALIGDEGDDGMLMPGRVQDFGTYRCEKELDACPWDIIGSELCRATTMSLQSQARGSAERHRPGPSLDYAMVEARGCGDRHCRIVAENREKYPMPEHALWESFGPIATADQIKYTAEEDCVEDPMVFREECGFKFANGTNLEEGSEMAAMVQFATSSCLYFFPTLVRMIEEGKVEEAAVIHVLKCVCEAAGKAAFGEQYARLAARDWLGVPVEAPWDGRIMGGHIEMMLQSLMCPYDVEAFNSEEVILNINRKGLEISNGYMQTPCHIAYWNGMVKTLVSPQWFVFEEGSSDATIRIRIAKRIDKFC